MRDDFDIDDFAILAAMPPMAGVMILRTFFFHALKQARNFFRRVNIRDFHAEKFFARKTVIVGGGVIDFEKVQRFQIIHPHRMRIVGKEQPETGFTFAQRAFDAFALGDVAADGIRRTFRQRRRAGPRQPFMRAIFAADAVFKINQRLAAIEFLNYLRGGQTIFGMNKAQIRLGEQFGFRKTQCFFKGRIDAFPIAIEAGDAEQIDGQGEEMIFFVERWHGFPS